MTRLSRLEAENSFHDSFSHYRLPFQVQLERCAAVVYTSLAISGQWNLSRILSFIKREPRCSAIEGYQNRCKTHWP